MQWFLSCFHEKEREVHAYYEFQLPSNLLLFPSFRLEFALGRLEVSKDLRSSGKVADLN